MPPAYVKPYLKRQKNDAADAEAICEAVVRPNMRMRGPQWRGLALLADGFTARAGQRADEVRIGGVEPDAGHLMAEFDCLFLSRARGAKWLSIADLHAAARRCLVLDGRAQIELAASPVRPMIHRATLSLFAICLASPVRACHPQLEPTAIRYLHRKHRRARIGPQSTPWSETTDPQPGFFTSGERPVANMSAVMLSYQAMLSS